MKIHLRIWRAQTQLNLGWKIDLSLDCNLEKPLSSLDLTDFSLAKVVKIASLTDEDVLAICGFY